MQFCFFALSSNAHTAYTVDCMSFVLLVKSICSFSYALPEELHTWFHLQIYKKKKQKIKHLNLESDMHKGCE